MTTQEAQSLVSRAYGQQQLTGKKDAMISVLVRGKYPDSGRKRLDGRAGPLGHCVAEFETDVLVAFKADDVISYAAKFLPTVKLSAALSGGDQ